MPKKILLADDSITIQKVVELTFSDGDYEVTAVNNGAKAIQKLSEMRPDIVLSDIIMPEKNGYEVCEYVKSHPELRHLPVILLTGTFEPFDPDRAEKAGCDAVVTKPFESQSLIHKVEELIAQTRGSASESASPAIEEPEAPPAAAAWTEEPPAPEASSFLNESSESNAGAASFTHEADIFGGTTAPPPPPLAFETSGESPFDSPPEEFGGETRAFPRMTFEEMQKMVEPPRREPEPPAAAPSPWDEAPDNSSPLAFSNEATDDMASSESDLESPFGAPPDAEEFSPETRAFPRMTLADIQKMEALAAQHKAETAPPPEVAEQKPEPLPWEEEDTASSKPSSSQPPAFEPPAFQSRSFDSQSFGGDTFEPSSPVFEGGMSFGEQQRTPEAEPESQGAMPWDEEPAPMAFGGETRAFPKLSFEELQQQVLTPAQPEMPSADEPAPAWASNEELVSFDDPSPIEGSTPEHSSTEDREELAFTSESVSEPMPEDQDFSSEPATEREPDVLAFETAPSSEDLPFASQQTLEREVAQPFSSEEAPQPEPEPEPSAPEPEWPPLQAAEAEADRWEPPVPPIVIAPEPEPSAEAAAAPEGDARYIELTDEQVERIARKVVELMSDQVVRNIAWEVIPDMAEMIVKERIRQLENE
ncbi:MAG TPA: response regulator [Thermoanaerobaculia bacterium]